MSRVQGGLHPISASLAASWRIPSVRDALDYLGVELDDLLRRALWSRLLADTGRAERFAEPDEAQLAKGFRRLAHIDDPGTVRFHLAHLECCQGLAGLSEMDRRRLTMLPITL